MCKQQNDDRYQTDSHHGYRICIIFSGNTKLIFDCRCHYCLFISITNYFAFLVESAPTPVDELPAAPVESFALPPPPVPCLDRMYLITHQRCSGVSWEA